MHIREYTIYDMLSRVTTQCKFVNTHYMIHCAELPLNAYSWIHTIWYIAPSYDSKNIREYALYIWCIASSYNSMLFREYALYDTLHRVTTQCIFVNTQYMICWVELQLDAYSWIHNIWYVESSYNSMHIC
jgi:hypothetical protein